MSQATQESTKKSQRNNILIFLVLFFMIIGVGYWFYYKSYLQFYETTDNAYVGQNIVYVTPQTAGSIDQVFVNEMQYVKAGEPLAHIDTRNALLTFEEAKANLAQSVRQIKQLKMQKEEAKSAISVAQVADKKAQDDLYRNQFLMKKGVIPDEKFQNIRYAYESAHQNLELMNKKLLSINALLKEDDLYKNPEIQYAIVKVQKAYLDLLRCDIIAPISATVAKKNFSIGQNVGMQTVLAALVPTEGFWVDANFKETQLEKMRLDQNVTLTSDIYGKDIQYHGQIEGIAPGTGAVFSLLPAQNASGNWIKIVQRVPVRIKLQAKELQDHPLQVGSSMTVTVDLHQQSQKFLKPIKNQTVDSEVYEPYKNAQAESVNIVQKIIEQNL